MALNQKMQKTIDYEDRIISEEVRRKMDDAVAKAEAEGIEVESEYYTGSDLDKMKEFARLNDIGVITGPFADYGRGVNVPRTPTLFNLFAMEEEISHNRQPEDPDPKKGSRPSFKAGPSNRLLNLKGMYDEEVRAKDEALEKTGGLLPKGKRTAELTRRSYAEIFKNGINRYVEETGDTETIKELFKQYPELRNVEETKYPKGDLPFKQGGVVPMNNMAKQMEMFDDGGLMDEGGTVDPVSGNDVPPGSNQEEVRDDIPAQLSEGEFVFPADVVRFIGLEKLMMIRQRAKAGLQRMDDMGQMGNSEEAVMPDDLPFSIEDLDMEDDGLEMAQGGVVHMANGGTYNVPDPNAGVYYNSAAQPTTGVAAAPMQAASSNIARSIPIAQAATPIQAGSSNQPAMFNNYELPQAPVPVMPQRDDLPAFLGEVTPGISGVDYVNEVYENEAGATETFRRYTDGRLLDENGNEAVIPEGYTIKSEAEKDVGTGPVKVKTATVQDNDGGSDNDDSMGDTNASIALGGKAVGPAIGGGIPGTRFAGPSRKVVGSTLYDVSFKNVGMNPMAFSLNMISKDGGLPPEGIGVIGVKGNRKAVIELPSVAYNSLRNDPRGQQAKAIQEALAARDALTSGNKASYVDGVLSVENKNGDMVAVGKDAIDLIGSTMYSEIKAEAEGTFGFGKTDNLVDTARDYFSGMSDQEEQNARNALSAYNDQQFSDFVSEKDVSDYYSGTGTLGGESYSDNNNNDAMSGQATAEAAADPVSDEMDSIGGP